MVGPGWSGDPGGEPGTVLTEVHDALRRLAGAETVAWAGTAEHWTGAGACGAAAASAATATATEALAAHVGRLAAESGAAGAAIARANARLRAIVDAFEERAASLEARLDNPGAAERLLAEAREALADAIAVVDELEAELDRHTATVSASMASSMPASTNQAGFSGPPSPAAASGPPSPATPSGPPSGSPRFHAAASGPPPGSPGLGGLPMGLGAIPAAGGFGRSPWSGAGSGDPAAFAAPPDGAVAMADPGGVAVRLPDGSTVTAPNAVAAGAVRHALTQLGVPYHWGGTAPGVGLDCSGLTQWAYREAGLGIPRLAQEQDVGAAVSPGALRPGDLAVWDGHVAMIVGNGMMIEAGDPVQLSAIRTTNAGQGFHGFFRPTA